MKAVQIIKPNQLEVIDVEKPVIDSKNNVLVKMTAAESADLMLEFTMAPMPQLPIRVLSDMKWSVSLPKQVILFLL